jgi:hypothetical protein
MSVDQFQKNWTECSGTGGRNARNGWTDSPEYAQERRKELLIGFKNSIKGNFPVYKSAQQHN